MIFNGFLTIRSSKHNRYLWFILFSFPEKILVISTKKKQPTIIDGRFHYFNVSFWGKIPRL